MCGIVGLVNIGSHARPLGRSECEDLGKAIEVQRHRGPDDTGCCGFSFSEARVESVRHASELRSERGYDGLFGFNRLSIKDLSMNGHQPMVSDDSTVVLVFNGEIYNDAGLREGLRAAGHRFRGTSDTEVVLRSYLEYGFEGMLERLNGMFAIVIADLGKGCVWLARDRFGIKPLYYSLSKGRLCFCSELKAFTRFGYFDRTIDADAAYARLVFSRPSEKVLFKDVDILGPGEAFRVDPRGNVRKWTYFDVDGYRRDGVGSRSMEDAVASIEEVLAGAVSRQMVSDVKVGCQLSGGIDSTLITYFANKLKGDNLNDTVSIVDEAGCPGEERYMGIVSRSLDLDAHKFELDPGYFLENYEKLTWHNDAPVYQPFFASFYRLAQKSKEHVTVLLSGEGSDEIAGGYSRFSAGALQPFVSGMASHAGSVRSYESYGHYAAMTDTTITGILGLDPRAEDDLIEEQVGWFDSLSGSDFEKHLKFETKHRLPEALMRQDKMTMAHSIENRVPFLDNEVVDLVMTLPEDVLVRFLGPSPMGLSSNPFAWMTGKCPFKEIAAKHFGRDFAYRKKTIMVLDKRKMLSSPKFEEYFHDAIYPSMSGRGLIDAAIVRDMFRNVKSIDDTHFTSMWRAIGLETWCQLFLDSREPA